ncbi:single strand DNA binding protein [Lactobacillus phage 521B]|uniref:Single-stranded DNA-binding protein n=1 Tax=Lactobacillus phage 521B TaxID=2510942 RepID=A0A4Y5FF72_9CAUD|nr:single strand DNA binding protein [Lactobacillus phage 521B]QBJ03520.1 hypothetical protein B521_0170 [Lactobacillus phage 521B]
MANQLEKILAQYSEQEKENSSSDGINVYDKLTHKVIRANQAPKMTFRILPPADLENGLFYKDYRKIMITSPQGYNSKFSNFVTESPENPENPLEKAVSEWKRQGIHFNKFNTGFRQSYYIQIVPVVQNGNSLDIKKDANGLPDVYVLDITSSLFDLLMKALGESGNDPVNNKYFASELENDNASDANQGSWSFLSPNIAYSVTITYNKNASKASDYYNLSVNAGNMLPPLPQGWETKLEDLDYLATPIDKANPDFMNRFIDDFNSQHGLQGNSVETPSNQVTPGTTASSSPFDDTPQQPAPQQPVPQQPAPQQPVPQQPAPQQPEQQSNNNGFPDMPDPFSDTGSSVDISDDDLPF